MKKIENSIGQIFNEILPGSFLMGETDEDESEYDELPVHEVKIDYPFYLSITEVTNQQYEKFDSNHKKFRGEKGFSLEDNEAVLFVSWEDAKNFCKWLSEKEGKVYRLPTEAEWEYACRAGTTDAYYTGNILPEEYFKRQISHESREKPFYKPVSLEVASTPANPWGLYDMHGNVEEWCYDWYGSYDNISPEALINPIGRENGIARVTRSGSHHTDIHYLRSASRMGALPGDRSWYIGFRVVQADLPYTKPLREEPSPYCMQKISQDKYNWELKFVGGEKATPIFMDPISYIHKLTPETKIPVFSHHHCPAITWCPNGDLFAIWFNTYKEMGREMVILGSRLRAGAKEWDNASVFFDVPDRNLTGENLFTDDDGTIFHMNGVEAAGSWNDLIMVKRISKDNGATWSTTEIVNPFHQSRNQVISCMIKTKAGHLIQCCDAVAGGEGGTAIHISGDKGRTWNDPGANQPDPEFGDGKIGSTIAGIHASIVELQDGSLMALGRKNSINDKMPQSISEDGGKTWKYSASEFPPITSGQRLVLRRLDEGPLLFVSFTDDSAMGWLGTDFPGMRTITTINKQNQKEEIFGLFVAISFDEGKTWPIKKSMGKEQPTGSQKEYKSLRNRAFIMDRTHGEPLGYLASTQSPDGIIHVISSRYHYRFNYAWLLE
jgi:formylglycine-generating enzyme required for sulfatase activity